MVMIVLYLLVFYFDQHEFFLNFYLLLNIYLPVFVSIHNSFASVSFDLAGELLYLGVFYRDDH